MIPDYLRRSFRQLNRYRLRNGFTFIGIFAIVLLISFLMTISFQLNALFKQGGLSFVQNLQVIELRGKTMSEKVLTDIKKMDEIEHILPVTGGSTRYPHVDMKLGEYQVLPLFIVYYDSNYMDMFQDKKLMQDMVSGEPGIVVLNDFNDSLMTKEQYKERFGIEESKSSDNLDNSINKQIKKYQNLQIPPEEKVKQLKVVGQDITINIDLESLPEQYQSIPETSKVKIIGKLSSNSTLSLPSGAIYYPMSLKNNMTKSNEAKFDRVLIKVSQMEDVPIIAEQFEEQGFQVHSRAKYIESNIETRKKFFNQLIIIMSLVMIVAIASFGNAMYSNIQERRGEIATMKALGASSIQIIFGIVLEGALLSFLAVILGLVVCTSMFMTLSSMIREGLIDPVYYERFSLDKESVLFVLQVPLYVYIAVTVVMMIFSFIMTYIPARGLFKKNYIRLMERG